jgi:hypothetical protein
MRFAELSVSVARLFHHPQRRVTHDSVEPPSDIAHLGSALQRQPRLKEPLLHSVFSFFGWHPHPVAMGEQGLAVPMHQHLECTFVPTARKRDQPRVGLGLQEAYGQPRAHLPRISANRLSA